MVRVVPPSQAHLPTLILSKNMALRWRRSRTRVRLVQQLSSVCVKKVKLKKKRARARAGGGGGGGTRARYTSFKIN
jgi:hypothetical protein